MSSIREIAPKALPPQILRKEYNDAMVDFVDFEVIYAALSTICGFPTGKEKPCSLSRMHDICNSNSSEQKGGTRWTNFINKKTKRGTPMKAAFPLVRECADFLALPAWLMLSPNGNEDLQHLLQTLPSGIRRFVLKSDFEVQQAEKQLRTWEHQNGNVSPDKLLSEMERLGLFDTVDSYPKQNKDPFNRVTGQFDMILKLMQSMVFTPHTYSFGGDIALRDMQGIPAIMSTFRMAKGFFPSHLNTKDRDPFEEWWQSCWYALRCPVNSYQHCLSYTEYVSQCFSDILDRFPFEIEVQEDGWVTRIYSWHSHRIQRAVDELKRIIIKRIPDSHGKLTVLMDQTYSVLPRAQTAPLSPLTSPDEFNSRREFLIWVSSDFSLTKRSMAKLIQAKSTHSRRPNTIAVLVQYSVLKEGTQLIFFNPDYPPELETDDLIAEVQITNGRPAVKWLRDGNTYSLSALAAKLIHLSGGRVPTRVNGNHYFHIIGESKSLYDKRRRLDASRKSKISTKPLSR